MKTCRRKNEDVNGLLQRSHVAIFETSLIYQGVWGKRTPSAPTIQHSEA